MLDRLIDEMNIVLEAGDWSQVIALARHYEMNTCVSAMYSMQNLSVISTVLQVMHCSIHLNKSQRW